MSVTEQRYQAVLAVLSEGRTISEVGLQWGVDRRTVHRWLGRYEAAGLEGLGDRSHRPVTWVPSGVVRHVNDRGLPLT
jgi:transposase-like protein